MDNLTTLIAIAIFCAFFAGNVFSSTQRRWRGRKAEMCEDVALGEHTAHAGPANLVNLALREVVLLDEPKNRGE